MSDSCNDVPQPEKDSPETILAALDRIGPLLHKVDELEILLAELKAARDPEVENYDHSYIDTKDSTAK